MTYLHEREILARFKLSLAERNIKGLVSQLNEEEIDFLEKSVGELGYDPSIITSNVVKKVVKVEKVELPNSLEALYYSRRRCL